MKRVKKIIHYCDNEIAEKGWLGRDVVVVVMDTGVALHPEIRERIWMFRDFVNEQKEVYDDNGHGTHVAGIIGGRKLGIAPLCKLIVLKVLDAEGNGKTEYCNTQRRRNKRRERNPDIPRRQRIMGQLQRRGCGINRRMAPQPRPCTGILQQKAQGAGKCPTQFRTHRCCPP